MQDALNRMRTQAAGFWADWVYDASQRPARWSTHPHTKFKIVSRFAAALVGPAAPFFTMLPQIAESIPATAWIAFGASWFVAVSVTAAFEEKSLVRHMVLGARSFLRTCSSSSC